MALNRRETSNYNPTDWTIHYAYRCVAVLDRMSVYPKNMTLVDDIKWAWAYLFWGWVPRSLRQGGFESWVAKLKTQISRADKLGQLNADELEKKEQEKVKRRAITVTENIESIEWLIVGAGLESTPLELIRLVTSAKVACGRPVSPALRNFVWRVESHSTCLPCVPIVPNLERLVLHAAYYPHVSFVGEQPYSNSDNTNDKRATIEGGTDTAKQSWFDFKSFVMDKGENRAAVLNLEHAGVRTNILQDKTPRAERGVVEWPLEVQD